MIDAKPLCIRFDKIDGFIRVYDGTIYLVLFESKKCDFTYSRIRYLIEVISDITYVISHGTEIKVDSYDSLPLEKTMTFRNVIMLIKSVFIKDKNNYYNHLFLEKTWNELPKI